MGNPFTIRSGLAPGQDAGSWDALGNVNVPGNLTVGGQINGTVALPSSATFQTLTAAQVLNTPNGPLTAPVTLTDQATLATNCTLGGYFAVTLGGNRTLGNPTGMVDGQAVIWELIQDGTGSRTLTLGSAFALGSTISSVTLTTTAGKRDFLGAIYRATTSKWYVVSFAAGY